MNINKNSWHFKMNLWFKSDNMWKMPKLYVDTSGQQYFMFYSLQRLSHSSVLLHGCSVGRLWQRQEFSL